MTVYHVNTEGITKVCGARTQPCPFGQNVHSTSREGAERIAEEYIAERVELETFPRLHDAGWVRDQAKVFHAEDFGGFSYRGGKEWPNYLAGFEAGTDEELGAEDEPRLEAEEAARQAEAGVDFDHRAFRTGFARALRVRDEKRFFLKTTMRDFSRDPYGNDNEKYDKYRFIHNPWKEGDEVLIPAETQYSIYEQGKWVRKVTAKPTRAYVDISSHAHLSGSVGKVFLNVGSIQVTANRRGHGDRKIFALTPELLSANGKPVLESPGHSEDYFRTPIYNDTHQWDKKDA